MPLDNRNKRACDFFHTENIECCHCMNQATIKILDEVGIEHIPKVGNVDVNIDWNTFDTGSLRIAWNETGDVWTNSMDDIV